ncbi:MAG: DUF5055 domain-containing protein [Lachnospiraceae bacterium]|nr:DUF5055 domain-containing protein [Lachnospiraceae bacterium]
MAEQVKPVVLKDKKKKKEYTLEFSRDSVRFAESRGFIPDDVEKYPMTKIYEFFFYAFRMHHPSVSRAETDAILDGWGGIRNIPDGLLERLGELYAAPFGALTEDETEEEKAEREKNRDVAVLL